MLTWKCTHIRTYWRCVCTCTRVTSITCAGWFRIWFPFTTVYTLFLFVPFALVYQSADFNERLLCIKMKQSERYSTARAESSVGKMVFYWFVLFEICSKCSRSNRTWTIENYTQPKGWRKLRLSVKIIHEDYDMSHNGPIATRCEPRG